MVESNLTKILKLECQLKRVPLHSDGLGRSTNLQGCLNATLEVMGENISPGSLLLGNPTWRGCAGMNKDLGRGIVTGRCPSSHIWPVK